MPPRLYHRCVQDGREVHMSRPHTFRCANCREVVAAERIPHGWWVLVNGELACSERCRDRAHFAQEQQRREAAFAYLREQQRRERLGIAQ